MLHFEFFFELLKFKPYPKIGKHFLLEDVFLCRKAGTETKLEKSFNTRIQKILITTLAAVHIS